MAAVFVTMCCGVAAFSDTDSADTQEASPTASDHSTSPSDYSPEVVRFTFQGKRKWQRIVIDDLDALVAPSGEKLLPIKRLLRAIGVKPVESDAGLAFQVDGAPAVAIDTMHRRVTIGNATATVDIVAAQSIVTQQDDFYVPTSSVAFMVSGDLAWDEQLYAFNCGLNRMLPMWKDFGASMFSARTQMIAPDLPEILPPAQPGTNGLDFMRLRVRSSAEIIDPNSRGNGLTADDITLDTWGSLGSGQLRVNVGARPSGGNTAAYGARQDALRLDLIEWSKNMGSTVVAAGDSRFGLNDLILPYTSLMGLRIQGTTGDRASDPAVRSYLQPRSFQGYAPVGRRWKYTLTTDCSTRSRLPQ